MHRLTLCLVALAAIVVLPTTASAQKVKMETNRGVIVIELDAAKAPISVKNFLGYVEAGFYNGLIFHRIIPGFMIQGGGFDQNVVKKPTRPPIKLEAGNGLSNKRGTLAMARTGVKDSATSQFFINHVDNARLDTYGGGYAVFGKVVEGMDVVDKIANTPTKPSRGQPNMPVSAVIITKMSVVKAAARPSK